MSTRKVRRAQPLDRDELAKLWAMLWPETAFEEHARELGRVLVNGTNGTLPMAILVSQEEAGALTGFLEVGMRSHADGCDTARPVGFVEGWFVQEPFRHQGIGRELMDSAEQWARAQGCVEMASDALIGNQESLGAHGAVGFEVVDRCIHFRKSLYRSK